MIIITHIHICTGRIYLEQKCKGPKTRKKTQGKTEKKTYTGRIYPEQKCKGPKTQRQ